MKFHAQKMNNIITKCRPSEIENGELGYFAKSKMAEYSVQFE